MVAPPGARRADLGTGASLPYLAQGDPGGTCVVLLHAWAESSGSFCRVMPLLPPTLHVVAPDLRGHGSASEPASGYALVDVARDVVALLDTLEVQTAVLVGSSSGGYVAQQVAVAHPERVRGLVLVGSPRTLRGRPPFAEQVEQLTDPVDRTWVARSLEWFPRFTPVPDWYVQQRIDDGVAMPASAWRASLRGLTDALPPTEAGTVRAPTLVIRGERDEILRATEQEALVDAIPGAQLLVYADTGHLVLWERPERVAADVAALAAALGG